VEHVVLNDKVCLVSLNWSAESLVMVDKPAVAEQAALNVRVALISKLPQVLAG